MNKETYLKDRKELLDAAETLIAESKTEEANAKMKEIEALDARWEQAKLDNANFNALKDKNIGLDLEAKSVTTDGKVIDSIVEPKKVDEKDVYLRAWAKDMQGLTLDDNEQVVFDKVNSEFKLENAAFVHTTGNTGAVIPESVVQGIWQEIGETYPLWNDVTKLGVAGNLTLLKGETSSDAKWYDEETETEDGEETFGELNLTGCELSRSITVSWKLKAMSIEAFIPYIQSKLAEKMGAGLGYGTSLGKGKPGESDTFKAEPKGVITALLAEADTPQVVEYTDAAPMGYTHFTNAFAKIKSGYLKGASIYADNKTIWGQIANILDEAGRPYFIPDVTTGGAGRILGLVVKEDDSITQDSVLIGNAKKGYLANVNQSITLDTEDHKKKRVTDYIAYGIVDGDVVSNKAFALIQKAIPAG